MATIGTTTTSLDIPTNVYPIRTESKKINWSGPAASLVKPKLSAAVSDLSGLYSKASSQMQGLLSELSGTIGSAYSDLDESLSTARQGVGLADTLADTLNRSARYAARSAIQSPVGLQGVINDLARRGILHSSVASDAISGATRSALGDVSKLAYSAASEGATAKINALNALAQLAASAAGTRGALANTLAEAKMKSLTDLATIAKAAPDLLSQLAELDIVASAESTNALEPYKLMVQLLSSYA